MTTLRFETQINAPIERVFDLSRSIEAHLDGNGDSQERVVAGRASGLLDLEETVTWEAVHLGVRQRFQSILAELQRPTFFRDTMVKGAFRTFTHAHHFEVIDPDTPTTLVTDVLDFTAPFGPLGRLAENLILARHLTLFIQARNHHLKTLAESDKWKAYLS